MTAEIRRIEQNDPLLANYRSDLVATSRDIWAGFWDGELVAVWGIAPTSVISDSAFIWSFTTPAVLKCKKTFLLTTKAWIGAMLQEFTELIGLTNCQTVFIKHLGAEFTKGIGDYALFRIRAR